MAAPPGTSLTSDGESYCFFAPEAPPLSVLYNTNAECLSVCQQNQKAGPYVWAALSLVGQDCYCIKNAAKITYAAASICVSCSPTGKGANPNAAQCTQPNLLLMTGIQLDPNTAPPPASSSAVLATSVGAPPTNTDVTSGAGTPTGAGTQPQASPPSDAVSTSQEPAASGSGSSSVYVVYVKSNSTDPPSVGALPQGAFIAIVMLAIILATCAFVVVFFGSQQKIAAKRNRMEAAAGSPTKEQPGLAERQALNL